jgi:hypothetical protein
LYDQPTTSTGTTEATATDPQDKAAAATSEPEASATGHLHYRGPDMRKHPLLGEQTFLLYWNKRGGGDFSPVGIWNNTDMSPKDQAKRADLLEFRFRTKAGQHLAASDLKNDGLNPGPPLEWRHNGGAWLRPSQRKGSEYYISVDPPNITSESDYSGGRNLMLGIQSCFVCNEGMRFALRMNIRSTIDAWISDEEHTGSIRMQDVQDRRAYLVAVRFGTDEPFQPGDNFYYPQSWQSMVDGMT